MPLLVLHPQNGNTIPPTIDIVAVHGLGGDSIKTWTHSRSHAFWLADFLPKKIPDARIMTFGYNAAAAFGRSTSDVVDHAKDLLSCLVDKREEPEEVIRPLVFIAHSLGGIVVKQALLQARLEPRYSSIHETTSGIIFFGTPHRGSEKATYGKVLAVVAQAMTSRPSPRLLSALQTNSDFLQRLGTDSRFHLGQYHISSLYEQRPMSIIPGLIVEKHSALLDLDNEEQIPVDANHREMCQFETDADGTFQKVYKRIGRMKTGARPMGAGKSAARYNKFFEVPHLLSPVFTGHAEVCRDLDYALGERPREHYQRRFVLWGLGGSGKTQLCVRFAQRHRERYWGIFWIDASSENSIRRCFVQIAAYLKIDGGIEEVKRAFANEQQSWLLIFDNADDPKMSLTPYFPTGFEGDIIITSRNPMCVQNSTVGSKEIGQLSATDAMALLVKTAYDDPLLADDAFECGEKIVSSLGCLALAVVQAGAYIRKTFCSLEQYSEFYEKRKRDMLDFVPNHVGTDYTFTAYTTWQVSLDMIESKQDQASRCALDLLKLFCFYHHDQIPLEMFYNAWQNAKEYPWSCDNTIWPESYADLYEYRYCVQESVALLASFSMISRDSTNSVSMHPLVHEWCRIKMSESDQRWSNERAILLLARSVKFEYNIEDYIFRRSLASHTRACLSLHHDVHAAFYKLNHYVGSGLELILYESGMFEDAVALLEQTMHCYTAELGQEHPITLIFMKLLSRGYIECGRAAEALELQERATCFEKKILGEEHPNTLSSMGRLALEYSDNGRLAAALQLSERLIKIKKKVLGEEHPGTIESVSFHAIILGKNGRVLEAIPFFEQVVQAQQKVSFEGHPTIVISMMWLAYGYRVAGRPLEAQTISEQAVKFQKRHLGENYSGTIMAMQCLGITYGKTKRTVEAIQLLEEVLQLCEEAFGKEHPYTLETTTWLDIFKEDVRMIPQAIGSNPEMAESSSKGPHQSPRQGFSIRRFFRRNRGALPAPEN